MSENTIKSMKDFYKRYDKAYQALHGNIGRTWWALMSGETKDLNDDELKLYALIEEWLKLKGIYEEVKSKRNIKGIS